MSDAIDTGSLPITGNFEITLPAPNGASLRITGYAYAGEDIESLNKRMDVCRDALTRQQSFLEKPVLEERVKMLKTQQEHVEKAYIELLEKNKAGRMASAERQHLQNYPIQLKQLREELTKGETKLAALA